MAGAAAQGLEAWTAEDVAELILVVATSEAADSAGAKRLFGRVSDVFTPRLAALSTTVILKVVVAAGAAAKHCRDLLEAAATKAVVSSAPKGRCKAPSSARQAAEPPRLIDLSFRGPPEPWAMSARPRPRPVPWHLSLFRELFEWQNASNIINVRHARVWAPSILGQPAFAARGAWGSVSGGYLVGLNAYSKSLSRTGEARQRAAPRHSAGGR